MLTLTPPAAARLNSLLCAQSDDAQSVIRMFRRDGRFRLRVDMVRQGDVTFDFDQRVVLALDTAVARQLSSRTLGVREIDGKPCLRFSRH